nr:sigma 54-interacting transcriptional regulator [uncultured Desulfobulbus sp.]
MDEKLLPYDDLLIGVESKQANSYQNIGRYVDRLSTRLGTVGEMLPLVSARVLKAPTDSLDTIINLSLQEILQSLGLERGGLLKVCPDSGRVVVAHAWYQAGIPMVSTEVNLAELFPWTHHQLVVLGKTVSQPTIDTLPVSAILDREAFAFLGMRSALNIPLFVGQEVRHIMVVHSFAEECDWPASLITDLRVLGEIFVHALERRNVTRALEISQTRLEMAATAAGVGFWEMDPKTGRLWFSKKARELFCFAENEQLTIAGFLEKIDVADRRQLAEAVKEAEESGGETRVEFRASDAEHPLRWMAFRGRVQYRDDEGDWRLMGVVADITVRKEMERKLVEQVAEIDRLRERLEQENLLLRNDAGGCEQPSGSLGRSSGMQKIQTLIDQVAKTESTVLIQGETGTGKELIAQALHRLSDRSSRLMITVNCAALPSALIESELFGREKGAYTGAVSRQVGRFELAHQSTLFLDEIAEMPLETQAKLLRVLQDGAFERLGSPTKITSNVRIIAATNRNLWGEVEHGRFRQDLYYRLNIFPIHVPPLRERAEDIALLTWKFVNEFGQKMGRKITAIRKEDMAILTSYSWPGNVRELRNVIERAMITSTGSSLDLSHLDLPTFAQSPSSLLTLEEVERAHIVTILQATRGRVKGSGGAAELLGLHPSTLYSRMRKLAINHRQEVR